MNYLIDSLSFRPHPLAVMQCDAENRLLHAGKPIAICSSKYRNNAIEQDHRRIKRRIRSMLGFKSEVVANIMLAGIELVHMMRKQQAIFTSAKPLSLKQQFEGSHSIIASTVKRAPGRPNFCNKSIQTPTPIVSVVSIARSE